MSRKANTDHPVHDLISNRWSPYTLDPNRGASEADVQSLFEAARWTMSSYNAQPWRYIVASRDRDPATWEKIHSVLVEGNQPWAKNAPILALGVIEHNFEHNGKPNKAAAHDLGAASAMLTVEATARGLSVHQMIGIEPEQAHSAFNLGESQEVLTGLAIGYLGDDSVVGEEYAKRQQGERQRKPLAELLIAGGF